MELRKLRLIEDMVAGLGLVALALGWGMVFLQFYVGGPQEITSLPHLSDWLMIAAITVASILGWLHRPSTWPKRIRSHRV